MNKTLGAMKARDRFGEVLNNEIHDHGDTVTIERRGKPMAVLVPIQYLEARLQAVQQIKAITEATSKRNKDIPSEVIEDEVL